MNLPEESNKSDNLTRRGVLGAITLGLAGIVGLGISFRGLLSSRRSAAGPGEGLPEDSIFKPREERNVDGRGSGQA